MLALQIRDGIELRDAVCGGLENAALAAQAGTRKTQEKRENTEKSHSCSPCRFETASSYATPCAEDRRTAWLAIEAGLRFSRHGLASLDAVSSLHDPTRIAFLRVLLFLLCSPCPGPKAPAS